MRIGFDAKRAFNNTTGLGNYSRTLLTSLNTYYPYDDYSLYTPKIKKNEEIRQFYSSFKKKVYSTGAILPSIWRSFGLTQDLLRDQIDIYHGLSNELPFNIHKISIGKIITIHDLIFKILPKTYNSIDRFIYDKKFRFGCMVSDLVIAVSQSTKEDIVNTYQIDPGKIEVVYQSCNPVYYEDNGVPEISRKYDLPSEYILYVGSVVERKNLKAIINALALIPEQKRIPLVVIGQGSGYLQESMKLVHEKKLDKSFRLISNMESSEELKAAYKGASIFIYPSYYEGFGIPVTEALLCRTPVITSNISSLPEAGGEGSVLVDPDQPESIANAVQEILDDSVKRNEMVEKGFAHAMQFHPETISKRIHSIYRSLY
jgi:glycosyltransferase involved in cell wall biosynthesis